MERVKLALVGCGVIANATYLPEITAMPKADLVAVCDIVEERARAAAEQFGVPHVYTDFDRMLDEEAFDLLVNTTHIQAHYETNLKALQSGRHVYSEKTMATTVEEATDLIEEARCRGLRLGAAAATMLDPVHRKVKELLETGAIGKVAFISAHHSHSGAAWFPYWATDPTWFYKPGAGPLLDLGVYGLHTITGLLGPAKRVACLSGIAFPVRYVRGGPYEGKRIDVELDDNTLLMLDFGDATFAMLDSTYCVRAAKDPRRMQIFGEVGTIVTRGELPLEVYRDDTKLDLMGWIEPQLTQAKRWSLPDGVAHLIDCILDPSLSVITSGEHARHVIEIMNRCYDAAREGRTVGLETTF
jgi:predicted dehydrogenase